MAWCEANGVTFCSGWRRTIGSSPRSSASLIRPGAEPAHRQAGAPLQGLQVDDAEQLEPPAPGRGEGGMDQRRGQSALHRHLAHACRVQGRSFMKMSIAPAATWRTGSRNASSISMPIAPRPPPCGQISCGCGSPRWPMCCCAPCAASLCITHRSPSDLRHHSSQATQDRRPRASECPPHQGRDGVGVRRPIRGCAATSLAAAANARASPA